VEDGSPQKNLTDKNEKSDIIKITGEKNEKVVNGCS